MQTRRQFIIRGGQLVAAVTAAATGPTVFSRDAQADSQLKILGVETRSLRGDLPVRELSRGRASPHQHPRALVGARG